MRRSRYNLQYVPANALLHYPGHKLSSAFRPAHLQQLHIKQRSCHADGAKHAMCILSAIHGPSVSPSDQGTLTERALDAPQHTFLIHANMPQSIYDIWKIVGDERQKEYLNVLLQPKLYHKAVSRSATTWPSYHTMGMSKSCWRSLLSRSTGLLSLSIDVMASLTTDHSSLPKFMNSFSPSCKRKPLSCTSPRTGVARLGIKHDLRESLLGQRPIAELL